MLKGLAIDPETSVAEFQLAPSMDRHESTAVPMHQRSPFESDSHPPKDSYYNHYDWSLGGGLDTKHPGRVVPPPRSSTEAYLLLEAARSDRTISRMRKDLAYEIIHRNVITLQLNRLLSEDAENELRAADEFVGHVRLSIRQNGYSVVREHAIQETHSPSHRFLSRELSTQALDVTLD